MLSTRLATSESRVIPIACFEKHHRLCVPAESLCFTNKTVNRRRPTTKQVDGHGNLSPLWHGREDGRQALLDVPGCRAQGTNDADARHYRRGECVGGSAFGR